MLKTYTNLYFRNPLPSYQLKELGFSYPISDFGPSHWMTYKFPVEYAKGLHGQIVPTLFGEIMVDPQDMEVRVNVKTESGTCYASFYSREYSYPKAMMDRIHRRIDKKLKEFDIIKIKPKKPSPERDEGENNANRTRRKKDGSTDSRHRSRDKEVLPSNQSKKDPRKRRKDYRKSI